MSWCPEVLNRSLGGGCAALFQYWLQHRLVFEFLLVVDSHDFGHSLNVVVLLVRVSLHLLLQSGVS